MNIPDLVKEARKSLGDEFTIIQGGNPSTIDAINVPKLKDMKLKLENLRNAVELQLPDTTSSNTMDTMEEAIVRVNLIRLYGNDDLSTMNDQRKYILNMLNTAFPPTGGRRMSYRSRKMKKHKRSKSHKKIKKGKRTKRRRY
jgi:hypothetical protein